MKVAVLGSGAGALAVAADMSRYGRRAVMVDLDSERSELDPVAERGGVLVADGGPGVIHPVAVADSVAEALAGAELAVVVAPCGARERWARAIAPHATPDHTVLLAGEGGGAIVARRAIEPPTVVAETNTLPHRSRAAGPAAVDVTPKRGGVLVASLPAIPPDTARVMELIGDVWPQAAATDTVWTTVLTSYDALESAATDAVGAAGADAVEAADAELRALRQALFSRESRGYHDFRTAQGLTPDSAPPAPAHIDEDVRTCRSGCVRRGCGRGRGPSRSAGAGVVAGPGRRCPHAGDRRTDVGRRGPPGSRPHRPGPHPGRPRPEWPGRHRPDRVRPLRPIPVAPRARTA